MVEGKIKVELELPKDEVIKELAKQAHVKAEDPESPKPEAKEATKPEPMSIREVVAKEIDPTVEGPIQNTTGYELGEIITAPLHPPDPKTDQKPVYGQVRSLVIGFAMMPVALIALLIFGGTVAISIALVGAALIALGVLVRI